ncbi:cytochrome b5 domain-containing protein RLF-like [Folsomia candida]|uniref:cytochrome b5 domain-containing protein RLF-like n=1 Tax=Folsomia candida TaxID=158441 RepID=UPI00160536B4|nr:cytochrome b5 domain-containing protein RLF-like [Folsomia candida]
MSQSPGPSTQDPSTRKITLEELKTHNTRNDAWIALKGSVYNVTDYANKHPGGYQAIQQGFGIDATKLFNQVHSYVNFEKILAGKKIGVLSPTKNTLE